MKQEYDIKSQIKDNIDKIENYEVLKFIHKYIQKVKEK